MNRSVGIFFYVQRKKSMPRGQKVATFAELVSKGFLQPSKHGRPSLYETDEERLAAKQAQQKECMKRHYAKIKEARELLKVSEEEKTIDTIKV